LNDWKIIPPGSTQSKFFKTVHRVRLPLHQRAFHQDVTRESKEIRQSLHSSMIQNCCKSTCSGLKNINASSTHCYM